MSKVIRIDEDVYEALAKQAQAFESPNKVLRRLLKLDTKPQQKS